MIQVFAAELPFGFLDLQLGMRDEAVPDHGLERLRVRGDESGIDGRHDDDVVADFLRVAAVAADDAEDFHAPAFALVERVDQIGADVTFRIAAADRKNEDRVLVVGLAGAQPGGEYGLPSFVVGPGGQLGDIVGRCIGFDPAQLAKVIDGVTAMSGAAADTEQEQAPSPLAQFGERHRKLLDRLMIDKTRDLARLIEERLDVTHAPTPEFLSAWPLTDRRAAL